MEKIHLVLSKKIFIIKDIDFVLASAREKNITAEKLSQLEK